MTRFVRRSLVATLVALHALLSVGGAGLHALPGWGHGSGLEPAAKNDHSHGPGKSSHQATEECPVCQFLAERGLVPNQHAGPPVHLVALADPPASVALRHPPRRAPSLPRAPPVPSWA